jgi:toxin ParE1/3/4
VRTARFLPDARREFLAEVLHCNDLQAGPGAHFSRAVEDATLRALGFPLAGSSAMANTRRAFLQGFPFSIVYRPVKNGIVVFALAHESRQPGYWVSRVQELPGNVSIRAA